MRAKCVFKKETELCSAFIAWVRAQPHARDGGSPVPLWTPYAETAGWDILLVGADGTQIGIQAKLRFNLKVLEQAIPGSRDHWHDQGPDYRAILVPDHDGTAAKICTALGLVVFAPVGRDGLASGEFTPGFDTDHEGSWHYWSPRVRCELPEFIPDVAAGSSAPRQLTKWKVRALRILATLEINGFVTREDFLTHGIDPRPWTGTAGWLKPGTRPGDFVRGDAIDFDVQHPTVYAEVLQEERARVAARGNGGTRQGENFLLQAPLWKEAGDGELF